MQILIRSQHLSHVQVSGGEQIEINSLDHAGPAVMLARPHSLVMLQEPLAAGISVVVKRDVTVGYVDMIAVETFGRDNSLRIKAG